MSDSTPGSAGEDVSTTAETAVHAAGSDLARGLPMFAATDPQALALAAERAELAELNARPTLARWRGFFAKTGPGWLQSAMTLGGGSAMASLFLGALFGYRLLWLQPFAMILGIVMLSAMSHQTLSTGARPFDAMKRHVTPAVAWAWAIATLVSTIIWHFPQYGLAAGMTQDMVNAATGWDPRGWTQVVFLLAVGFVVLAVSTAIVWNYAEGRRGIRLYERMLKILVWMIVIAFAIVTVKSTIDGRIAWGQVFKGFLPLYVPSGARGVSTLMAAFGAAVGINMTFLFPYTLLARGWGKEHRGLSRFDLVTGMLLPYVLATSLMVIVAGSTVYNSLENYTAADLPNEQTAALAAALVPGADEAPAPARRIWHALDDDGRAALRSVAAGGDVAGSKAAVVASFNDLVASRDFFRPGDFAGVKLPPDASALSKRDRATLDEKEVRVLNRQAIDSALVVDAPPGAEDTKAVRLVKPLSFRVPPVKAARMFQDSGMSPLFSRFVFGLGVLGMALSTITMHMLVSGFAFCEILGIEPGGRKYKLACLVPAVGILGVVLWPVMGPWIAIPTSAVCGLLLPIAYIGTFVLNNRKGFLGKDTPAGGRAWAWNIAMGVAILTALASSVYYVCTKLGVL